MLTPKCNITIASKKSGNKMRFTGCSEFALKRSVEELSATGTVHLPTMAAFDNKKREILAVRESVAPGDSIIIEAGYAESGLHELFNGYIKAINTGTRVKLVVEDSMFVLRQHQVVVSILKDDDDKARTIKYLLDKILDGSDFKSAATCIDMPIDGFQYKGNAAGALVKIKEQFGLTVYVNKDKMVYVGLEAGEILSSEQRKEATINVTYGVNIVSNDVEYQTPESNPLKVVVKGINADGKSEEEGVAGIDGGNIQTYMEYNVTDKEKLDIIANEKYAKQSYNGFRGTITLFGIPLATPGGTVVYKNENYEGAEGQYFIKAVDTSLSTNGLRQILTMGYKLS